MYTVIFNREPYSGDEGNSDGACSVHRCVNAREVHDLVTVLAKKQIRTEQTHVIKYNRKHSWQHPYGDWGFMVLYKGYVHTCTNGFNSEYMVDDFTLDDESEDILLEVPTSLDVIAIMSQVLRSEEQLTKVLSEFKDTEKDIYKLFTDVRVKYNAEVKERKQLEELLAKYPDMVK